MISILTVDEMGEKYKLGRTFFADAIRLGYIELLSRKPARALESSVDAFLTALTPDQTAAIRAIRHSKAALPLPKGPGRPAGTSKKLTAGKKTGTRTEKPQKSTDREVTCS